MNPAPKAGLNSSARKMGKGAILKCLCPISSFPRFSTSHSPAPYLHNIRPAFLSLNSYRCFSSITSLILNYVFVISLHQACFSSSKDETIFSIEEVRSPNLRQRLLQYQVIILRYAYYSTIFYWEGNPWNNRSIPDIGRFTVSLTTHFESMLRCAH